MVSLIQECASSGQAAGSISFDFVPKSDGMALARQGERQADLVKLFRCFSGNARSWTGQLGVANRIWKDAFDWQTKGRAGHRPGLNSAWRPDVNGLAIQTQMAQRPRHQCQDLARSPAVMSKPLQHHCRQELFRSHRVSRTGLPRLGQGILTRGVKAVRILPTTVEA